MFRRKEKRCMKIKLTKEDYIYIKCALLTAFIIVFLGVKHTLSSQKVYTKQIIKKCAK